MESIKLCGTEIKVGDKLALTLSDWYGFVYIGTVMDMELSRNDFRWHIYMKDDKGRNIYLKGLDSDVITSGRRDYKNYDRVGRIEVIG